MAFHHLCTLDFGQMSSVKYMFKMHLLRRGKHLLESTSPELKANTDIERCLTSHADQARENEDAHSTQTMASVNSLHGVVVGGGP